MTQVTKCTMHQHTRDLTSLQQGGYGDSKYGFSATTNGTGNGHEAPPYHAGGMAQSPPHSPLYGTVPELPPRGGVAVRPTGGVLLPAPPPGRPPHTLRHNPQVCNV